MSYQSIAVHYGTKKGTSC